MADPPLDQNGSQQIQEVSREEILKQIFGDIGELIDDFTCAVESTVLVHGRMYITNKFICFYSNLFGLEKKIRIPYSHIKGITKENTAMVIPNAIAISTDKKDYIFRSFWDREDCFRILTAFLAKFKGYADSDKPKAFVEQSETASVSKSTVEKDAPIISDYFINENTAETTASTAADTNSSTKRLSVRPVSSKRPNGAAGGDNDDVYDTESGFRPNSAGSGADDLSAQFEQEVAKSRLKITVVTAESLPLSVHEFFSLFICETAPFSFKKYHESVKDTNLAATPWSELSSSLGEGREIKFFKPVNLPGLASTRGVKVQRFRRFGETGLVLCSSTRLEDVPAADTFSVEDMIAVKAVDAGSVSVEITFQVTFIKSTYMKYIIDRSTNFEMTKWLEALFAHLKKTAVLLRDGKITIDSCGSPLSSPSSSSSSAEQGQSVAQTPLAAESSAAISAQSGAAAPNCEGSSTSKDEVPGSSNAKPSFGSLADLCRVVVVVALLAYLLRCGLQWGAVHGKIARLENKIDQLDRLVSSLLVAGGAQNHLHHHS